MKKMQKKSDSQGMTKESLKKILEANKFKWTAQDITKTKKEQGK